MIYGKRYRNDSPKMAKLVNSLLGVHRDSGARQLSFGMIGKEPRIETDLVSRHWEKIERLMWASCNSCGKRCTLTLFKAASESKGAEFVANTVRVWKDCSQHKPIKRAPEKPKLYNARNELGGLKACLGLHQYPQHPK